MRNKIKFLVFTLIQIIRDKFIKKINFIYIKQEI